MNFYPMKVMDKKRIGMKNSNNIKKVIIMSKIPRPKVVKSAKRLTLFAYGEPNSGKTWAAIHFPNAYIIDVEGGARHDQYTDIIEQRNNIIINKPTYDEIITIIKALYSEKHEFKTIVIDSISKLYNLLLVEGVELLAGSKEESKFSAEYQYANKKIKKILSLLFKLDMNVICTGYVKDMYGAKMEILGKTFECTKNIDHEFDLAIHTQKEMGEYKGYVKKSRITGFTAGDKIDFSYDVIASRYGKNVLEKEAAPIVLASSDQVAECRQLIQALSIAKEVYGKWLLKSDADKFSEMKSDEIQKCIEWMKSKIVTPEESGE